MTERIARKRDFNMCERGGTVFTFVMRHPVSLARTRENFMFKGVRVS